MTSMSAECPKPITEQDREETLSYLSHEDSRWVNLKQRVERTAGGDGELLKLKQESMGRLDHMLEDLFMQNVVLSVVVGNENPRR